MGGCIHIALGGGGGRELAPGLGWGCVHVALGRGAGVGSGMHPDCSGKGDHGGGQGAVLGLEMGHPHCTEEWGAGNFPMQCGSISAAPDWGRGPENFPWGVKVRRHYAGGREAYPGIGWCIYIALVGQQGTCPGVVGDTSALLWGGGHREPALGFGGCTLLALRRDPSVFQLYPPGGRGGVEASILPLGRGLHCYIHVSMLPRARHWSPGSVPLMKRWWGASARQ